MTQPSPAALWTGRVLTGLFALFMLGASIAPKLLDLPVAHETMAQLGWPPGYVLIRGAHSDLHNLRPQWQDCRGLYPLPIVA